MRIFHYKLLIIGQASWRTLREGLPQYTPGALRGWVLLPPTPNRIRGQHIYHRIEGQKRLDPETLEERTESIELLAKLSFELDFQKGLVCVQQKRSNLNALFEGLEAIPGVNVDFDEINLNLRELLLELQGAYRRNVIKTLRIEDYLARENMLASTAFKIIEPQDGEKIADKFEDQLDAFTLTLKLPDGAISVSVTRRGTIKASDECPDELLMFIRDLLPRFHQAEVETAEVVDPVVS